MAIYKYIKSWNEYLNKKKKEMTYSVKLINIGWRLKSNCSLQYECNVWLIIVCGCITTKSNKTKIYFTWIDLIYTKRNILIKLFFIIIINNLSASFDNENEV